MFCKPSYFYHFYYSNMTNKVLKIYPITEQISLGDIVSLLKNFKLEEVKIKKPIVMVRFRNFNKEI